MTNRLCDIRDYVLENGDAFVATLHRVLVLVRALNRERIGHSKSLVR